MPLDARFLEVITSAPSTELVDALNEAFRHFNRTLFEDKLPLPMFAYQRKKGCHGHYSPGVWRENSNSGKTADEISLNPDFMDRVDTQEIMQTLVHEMCHQLQHHHGKPSRGGYHNAEWGAMMEAVGLIPSNTGAEGGKKTGQQMMDYPEEGGAFLRAWAELQAIGWRFPWISADTETPAKPKKPKKPSKVKFECMGCGSAAWGKPSLNIMCGDCETHMIAPEADEADG